MSAPYPVTAVLSGRSCRTVFAALYMASDSPAIVSSCVSVRMLSSFELLSGCSSGLGRLSVCMPVLVSATLAINNNFLDRNDDRA